MGKTNLPIQPKERRISNIGEVILGFGKKENVEEARRCPQCAVATCLPGCPLGIDIPGFIRLLREDDAVGALTRIRLQNPFPAICGRICPAPCEKACIFNDDGTAISIRALERYASDVGKPKLPKEKQTQPKNRKVTIVGSGPAGMSAAYYLAQAGFTVTILEALSEPGGLLRYGIPEFRLPARVIDEQFATLINLGVVIKTNSFVGSTISMQEVFAGNQAAVLLTLGAGVANFINIKGHDLGGVYYAQELLMRAHQISKNFKLDAKGIWQGKQTVVLGGDGAALDAARLSIRAGQKVTLIFDGLEEEMGIRAEDLQLAQEEGVVLSMPMKALAIEGNAKGFATALTVEPLTVVEEEDRLVVKADGLERTTIEAQTVILSTGRKPNTFIRQHLPQLRLDEDGSIWVDAQTGLTSIEKIFAAGNVVTGAGSVVDAIASGKAAAGKIMEFLSV